MKVRKLAILAGTAAAVLALSSAPAFAQDCFLTKASPNSHNGQSAQWAKFNLADVLTAPAPDGFGLECQEQVDATLEQVEAAGLPTVFMTRTTRVLPDAGGRVRAASTTSRPVRSSARSAKLRERSHRLSRARSSVTPSRFRDAQNPVGVLGVTASSHARSPTARAWWP